MFPYGTHVRSLRSSHLKNGIIVGYGTIMWPSGPNINGDDGTPVPVYLVQLDGCEGSSHGRTVTAIFRVDQTEEVI